MRNNIVNMLFSNIRWISNINLIYNNRKIYSWLNERYSMTKRLEKYSKKIVIKCLYNNFIQDFKSFFKKKYFYLQNKEIWLREILLYGNNSPWMLARSLIPVENNKIFLIKDILELQNVPLGVILYQGNIKPIKEYIRFGIVGNLWTRQTKFNFNKSYCLLLTEIFLPECPLYRDK